MFLVRSSAEERYDVLELRAFSQRLFEGVNDGAVFEVIRVEMRGERGKLMVFRGREWSRNTVSYVMVMVS